MKSIITETVEKSYDDFPYKSNSFGNTYPTRQKAILKLLDFETPSIETARVLEIGCSFGGNIIPFAINNPKAQVIGIDISNVQIKEGNKIIKKLKLKNIKLLCQDVTTLDNSIGYFDYIICHGVFSWVSEEVQNGILSTIKNLLNPNGSAIISYNTYPGWKNIDVIKDIMNFRVSMLKDQNYDFNPNETVEIGISAINFLKEYGTINDHVKSMIENINKEEYYYIYHEYFEKYNQPLYLYEFNKKLEKYGLMHIIDSDLNKSFPNFSDSEVKKAIENECGDNNILKEQYYDFLNNTQFRSSIITHAENKEKINTTGNIYFKNINEIHVLGTFDENDNPFVDEVQPIIKSINEAYPNSIKISDLYDKHSNIENFYTHILNLIQYKYINYFTEPVIVDNQEKLKISDSYRSYISYMIETEQPLINISNFSGISLKISNIEYSVMLFFNGELTDEDIEKIILDKIEKNEFQINNLSEDETKEDFVKRYVKNIRKFIVANKFNISYK